MARTHIKKATFYKAPFAATSSVAYAEQLHGKELSYNNINDADAALSIVKRIYRTSSSSSKTYESMWCWSRN